MAAQQPDQQQGRTNYDELSVGDYLSETQYYRVLAKDEDVISVCNERGMEFPITKDIVTEGMYTATQFTETQKVSRTRMAELLEGAKDTIFQVTFKKMLSPTAVAAQLSELEALPATVAARRRLAKELLTGDERTLIGHLVTSESRLGRSSVVDLTLDPSVHRLRLVDHRTISRLILRNVCYEV